MGVAKGEGKGVGLVLGGLVGEAKQDANHVLDLNLLRAPGADHSQLDGLGTVLVDREVAFEPGTDHGTSSLPDLQGGCGIAGEYQLFDRHLVGTIIGYDPNDAVEDRT